MVNEILSLIVRTNIALAVCVLLVLALRFPTRRLAGARIAYALWLIPPLAAAACFSPEEAPKLWERMGALSRQKPPEFASTHPSDATRIDQLNAWMPEADSVRGHFCSGGAATGQP